jgi:hypothetical protein
VLGACAALGSGVFVASSRVPSTRDQPPVDGGSNRSGSENSTEVTLSMRGSERSTATSPSTDAAFGADPTPAPSTTDRPAEDLVVICRSAWGAVDPVAEMQPHRIERLTLHHTAVELADNTDAPARTRQHQRFHQDSGFSDLAYHFMVDLEGNVLEGRSTEFAGETFTEYDPTGHLLVCCEGNFDLQSPTEAQIDAVALVFAWGCLEFGVDPGTLAGHRAYASTTCPGDDLEAHLEDGSLAEMITEKTTAGVVFNLVCGQAAVQRVAEIESL